MTLVSDLIITNFTRVPHIPSELLVTFQCKFSKFHRIFVHVQYKFSNILVHVSIYKKVVFHMISCLNEEQGKEE